MDDQRYKVVVVDDNRIIRHLLRLTFADKERYQVFEAECGEQALPIVIREHPQIIVLDIMMPGELNGLQLCQMIKSWPDCQDSKIILLSACGQQDDLQRGKDAGADLYIIKPFSPIKLLAEVDQLLTDSK